MDEAIPAGERAEIGLSQAERRSGPGLDTCLKALKLFKVPG